MTVMTHLKSSHRGQQLQDDDKKLSDYGVESADSINHISTVIDVSLLVTNQPVAENHTSY